jgi:hypothetical protein
MEKGDDLLRSTARWQTCISTSGEYDSCWKTSYIELLHGDLSGELAMRFIGQAVGEATR